LLSAEEARRDHGYQNLLAKSKARCKEKKLDKHYVPYEAEKFIKLVSAAMFGVLLVTEWWCIHNMKSQEGEDIKQSSWDPGFWLVFCNFAGLALKLVNFLCNSQSILVISRMA
jgi:hypothetical protein